MNENLDLTKILDGCPEGTKLYSTIHGEVIFQKSYLFDKYPLDYPIKATAYDKNANSTEDVYFAKDGRYICYYDGECTLFPSKDQRDWSKFERFWDKPKMQKPTNDRMADGVYLIGCKGNAVRYDGKDTETLNDTSYIGIVQGSHSVAIALRDVSEDGITLTSKTDDSKDRYIDNYRYAMQDWNGQQNTENLQAAGIIPVIQLKEGEYIPTAAELYLIFLNCETINEAIRFVGGQELKGWYLSSTVYSKSLVWQFYVKDSYPKLNIRASIKGRVRPVTTFEV